MIDRGIQDQRLAYVSRRDHSVVEARNLIPQAGQARFVAGIPSRERVRYRAFSLRKLAALIPLLAPTSRKNSSVRVASCRNVCSKADIVADNSSSDIPRDDALRSSEFSGEFEALPVGPEHFVHFVGGHTEGLERVSKLSVTIGSVLRICDPSIHALFGFA